jgi:hypothetical protein
MIMPKKPTLKDMVSAAQKAGAKVSFSLDPKDKPNLPLEFPDDPESVRLLIGESRRLTDIGNQWLEAKSPNAIAAESALRCGWAMALAAGWLRCKLKGELLPESKEKP